MVNGLHVTGRCPLKMVTMVHFVCGFDINKEKAACGVARGRSRKASEGWTPLLCYWTLERTPGVTFRCDIGLCPFPSGSDPPTQGQLGA